MTPSRPRHLSAGTTEAREHIARLSAVSATGREEVILTRYGAPAAVVISFEEYQRLKKAGEATPSISSRRRPRPSSRRVAAIPSAAAPARAGQAAHSDRRRVRPAAVGRLRGARAWREHGTARAINEAVDRLEEDPGGKQSRQRSFGMADGAWPGLCSRLRQGRRARVSSTPNAIAWDAFPGASRVSLPCRWGT